MELTSIRTLGELKKSGYKSISIKEELRKNLIANIKVSKTSFEGIHGYEDSVIPQVERAILAKHNINLLGLRGQAKTRIARQMVGLLDEWIPVIEGSEINDDPFAPISSFAVKLVAEKKDDTPITWLHRSKRFAEKLATPDVSVADIIGDIDPIKAANLKLNYADEGIIHFGMIPRANRSIFVINELPDLQARIQVSLFNILQEGDIQIRGFNLRLNLDVLFVFTANPEDYTNRGSIITPLKDRIESQILTHYPPSIEIAKTITAQEINLSKEQQESVFVPEVAKELIEQVVFSARESEYIDHKSGVSARLSIAAMENLISTAERRALANNESKTSIRLSDFIGIIPAITGKVELLYEGEQAGAEFVATKLIETAINKTYNRYFPEVKKLEKENEELDYNEIVEWFANGNTLEIYDNVSSEEYEAELSRIDSLDSFVKKYNPSEDEKELLLFKELVIWNLSVSKKLSKNRFTDKQQFDDLFDL
jgi:magnesium chelatase subunit I